MAKVLRLNGLPAMEPKKSGWHPSIRVYLVLMNVALLCFLFPAASFLLLHEQAEFRDAQLLRTIKQINVNLKTRGASLSRNMALSSGQAVSGFDFTFLNIMVRQLVSNDREVIYCIIMDTNKRAIAHSNSAELGSVLNTPMAHQVAALLKNDFPAHMTGETKIDYVRFIETHRETSTGREQILEVITPIYNGANLWGVLRSGYSLKMLHNETVSVEQEWAAKMKQFRIYLITITGIFIAAGIIIAAMFTHNFVKSMDFLSNGFRRVTGGDLDHPIEQKGLVCSEIMKLSDSFNTMTARLKVSYHQLGEYSKNLEQKVMERTSALKDAQANLLQQAHEAGMAEMGMGILHNIGNAITPAKVGTATLVKGLRQSPVRNNLKVAMDQIYSALEQSPAVQGDERQRLLSVVKLLPESIQEEYDKTIDEILLIRNKHEHIEEIISLQMRYAKLSTNFEKVDINRLIEDALKIIDELTRKRSAQIVKNFSKIPVLKMEQAKLIQIIINLIKNSYEAMEKTDAGNRQITISTFLEKGPPDNVALSIKDTGIGFSPEEKEKLFTFGYTTKDKGTGFGLHSCANYLIAHKGSIEALSKGKGLGATFIVRLTVG